MCACVCVCVFVLQGYATGNGVTDDFYDGNGQPEFAYNMGLIDPATYDTLIDVCGGQNRFWNATRGESERTMCVCVCACVLPVSSALPLPSAIPLRWACCSPCDALSSKSKHSELMVYGGYVTLYCVLCARVCMCVCVCACVRG